MTRSSRLVRFSSTACVLVCLVLAYGHLADSSAQASEGKLSTAVDTAITDTARANELIRRQPGFFVPNLGQWEHPSRFVHGSGSMTLFLEDRGWVMDLRERPRARQPDLTARAAPLHRLRHDAQRSTRGVAVRMSFVGSNPRPKLIGEGKLPGRFNYFLGNEESRWRTDVPRHTSVRYEDMYPGVDVRMRSVNGRPEYDLLCEAGSDLSEVSVEVDGADGLTIDEDGSLRIETALGPIRQTEPKTWECLGDGGQRSIQCEYVLLGDNRFGFATRDWSGANALVIDPGLLWSDVMPRGDRFGLAPRNGSGANGSVVDPKLLWSTYLGGSGNFGINMALAIHVDARGVVTVTGMTAAANFPTTTGAYDSSHNGTSSGRPFDVFVSQLDPRKSGAAQLIYSTFLGGNRSEQGGALAVDSLGVITVAGTSESANFPTTANAFDRTHNGGFGDAFLSRLDPRRTGTAQLVYSTLLGGSADDGISDFGISPAGVVTVVGGTGSSNFPTTNNAFDTSYNGGAYDGFVCRLDLSRIGSAQLTYSTFLGGKGYEGVTSLAVDTFGYVNVAGGTISTDFPTTTGAFDTSFNGGKYDGFVGRLNLALAGSAQLTYGTYLGGLTEDLVTELSVDVTGVLTVAGGTQSTNFPATTGAFDTTHNGGIRDSFVGRLDPSKLGKAQLVYSTFLGGSTVDDITGLAVNADGVVTVSGSTSSTDFPTTTGAYDTTLSVRDIFVSRLDPRLVGTAQMVYSTFLGGSGADSGNALAVDASGVATVAGWTGRTNTNGYPATLGAYSRNSIGFLDAVVTRLDMGVALYADTHQLPLGTGGTQTLRLRAGRANANRFYWIFGSISGTSPGINLLGVHIPLNPDTYTSLAMGAVNSRVFTKFKGVLSGGGLADASFNVPANFPLTFHHAYVVYDASGKIYMASNAVPLTLR